MYTPRVLLCGNLKKFLAATNGRTIYIVGKISFKGAAERGEFIVPNNADVANKFTLNEADFKIFLDGAEISADNLRGLLDGKADYIVIENHDEYLFRFRELYALKLIDRVITVPTLLTYATDNFFALNNAVQIFNLIRQLRVLDADAFFERNDYYMFPDANHKIAGVVDADFSHFYAEIYRTPEDCRFKFFDALLLTAERSPAEFIDTLIETDSLAENIFVFVRKSSALEKFLAANENAFEKISRFPAINGNWILLNKFVRADFKIYVVTHKAVELENLPEGYKIIHAGKAPGNDLGYLGDDSGDNISRLNLYVNEITALYWLWKNTRHDFIGFVHYRRFFTTDGKNILTTDAAREILRDCDIIVNGCEFGHIALRDWKIMLSTRPLAEHVINTIRKFIALRQPDYLAAYDRVTNSFGVFCYEIFITRRKIFEAYCEWLFSFIIDATEEILSTTEIASSDDPRIYRSISFTAEHLMTVWLIKNRLKIKTLPIIFRDNV